VGKFLVAEVAIARELTARFPPNDTHFSIRRGVVIAKPALNRAPR
jgi:hypothetical protein